MVSMRMPSCNSPRPETIYESAPADSSILSATLPSASLNSRARIMRLVTLSPSVPAKGESLTIKVIDKVGGSMGCACKGSVTSGAHNVSATLNFVRPAIATISPASASSTGVRSIPRKAKILETRPVSTMLPLRSRTLTCWFVLRFPENTRPVIMRPKYALASNKVPSILKEPSSMVGGATCSKTKSSNGSIPVCSASGALAIHP